MSETSNVEADRLLRCSALLADSPTFKHVLDFAFRMEAKLAKNRHKGDRSGWLKDHPWNLVERILDETVEVQQCFAAKVDGSVSLYKSPEQTADECADVANFCMMVADRVTSPEPPSEQAPTISEKICIFCGERHHPNYKREHCSRCGTHVFG